MQEEEGHRGRRWALRVRYALMAAIAVMVVLLLFQGPRSGSPRYVLNSAYAESVAAAPGFLAVMLPGGGGDVGGGGAGGGVGGLRFYLVDTTKQVVCVYTMVGDRIRLVSAREYSRDMDIVDASLTVPTKGGAQIRSFEGTQGIDRATAEAYADGLREWQSKSEKK